MSAIADLKALEILDSRGNPTVQVDIVLSSGALLLNILLNILFIPRWGILGAALATAISMSALSLLGIVQVKRTLNLWPYDRRYGKGVFAITATVLAVMLLHWSGIGSPFWGVLIASVVFPASLWLVGLEAEDRQVVDLVRERIMQ